MQRYHVEYYCLSNVRHYRKHTHYSKLRMHIRRKPEKNVNFCLLEL